MYKFNFWDAILFGRVSRRRRIPIIIMAYVHILAIWFVVAIIMSIYFCPTSISQAMTLAGSLWGECLNSGTFTRTLFYAFLFDLVVQTNITGTLVEDK